MSFCFPGDETERNNAYALQRSVCHAGCSAAAFLPAMQVPRRTPRVAELGGVRRCYPSSVNESQTIPTQNDTDAGQRRRFVRWLLFALVVSSIVGVVSLATGITSFSSHTDSSGTVTTLTHHTVTSRVVLSAATVFHVALVFGIFVRSRLAWSAAFILPPLWTLVVATMNWSQLFGTPPDWSAVIPIACIVGIGVWQTFIWRRQWAVCEGYFQ